MKGFVQKIKKPVPIERDELLLLTRGSTLIYTYPKNEEVTLVTNITV